ncbi:hypothetical protein ACFVUH_35565 [Kitasatospora sp. NPDC058032]|uniref:hypothetical protein n=1 Tax=Kitasatospora sp. NPDC058032 TaxID=3346307 RepID=UPI0036DEEC7D
MPGSPIPQPQCARPPQGSPCALGERADVAHSAIARILGGEVLTDIGPLARLEDALDHQLWPGRKALRDAAARHGRSTTRQ